MDLREALEIVGDQNGRVDVQATAAELRELRTEVSLLRSENQRLRELATDARDAWTGMGAVDRSSVRLISGRLYDALGPLATYVSTKAGA